MSSMTSVDTSDSGTKRHGADAVDCCSGDNTNVSGNNTDKGKSSQTSWLYQCKISECSATFERLIDLRMHFIDIHQPGTQFACYCLVVYYSTLSLRAHVNKTPISCFRLNVFRLKKLNKRNFSDIGLVISKQKSC